MLSYELVDLVESSVVLYTSGTFASSNYVLVYSKFSSCVPCALRVLGPWLTMVVRLQYPFLWQDSLWRPW